MDKFTGKGSVDSSVNKAEFKYMCTIEPIRVHCIWEKLSQVETKKDMCYYILYACDTSRYRLDRTRFYLSKVDFKEKGNIVYIGNEIEICQFDIYHNVYGDFIRLIKKLQDNTYITLEAVLGMIGNGSSIKNLEGTNDDPECCRSTMLKSLKFEGPLFQGDAFESDKCHIFKNDLKLSTLEEIIEANEEASKEADKEVSKPKDTFDYMTSARDIEVYGLYEKINMINEDGGPKDTRYYMVFRYIFDPEGEHTAVYLSKVDLKEKDGDIYIGRPATIIRVDVITANLKHFVHHLTKNSAVPTSLHWLKNNMSKSGYVNRRFTRDYSTQFKEELGDGVMLFPNVDSHMTVRDDDFRVKFKRSHILSTFKPKVDTVAEMSKESVGGKLDMIIHGAWDIMVVKEGLDDGRILDRDDFEESGRSLVLYQDRLVSDPKDSKSKDPVITVDEHLWLGMFKIKSNGEMIPADEPYLLGCNKFACPKDLTKLIRSRLIDPEIESRKETGIPVFTSSFSIISELNTIANTYSRSILEVKYHLGTRGVPSTLTEDLKKPEFLEFMALLLVARDMDTKTLPDHKLLTLDPDHSDPIEFSLKSILPKHLIEKYGFTPDIFQKDLKLDVTQVLNQYHSRLDELDHISQSVFKVYNTIDIDSVWDDYIYVNVRWNYLYRVFGKSVTNKSNLNTHNKVLVEDILYAIPKIQKNEDKNDKFNRFAFDLIEEFQKVYNEFPEKGLSIQQLDTLIKTFIATLETYAEFKFRVVRDKFKNKVVSRDMIICPDHDYIMNCGICKPSPSYSEIAFKHFDGSEERLKVKKTIPL